MLKDFKAMEKIITEFVKNQDLTIKKNYISPFRLEEFYNLIGQYKTNEGRLLLGFANYLEGKVAGEEVLKLSL